MTFSWPFSIMRRPNALEWQVEKMRPFLHRTSFEVCVWWIETLRGSWTGPNVFEHCFHSIPCLQSDLVCRQSLRLQAAVVPYFIYYYLLLDPDDGSGARAVMIARRARRGVLVSGERVDFIIYPPQKA